MPGTLNYVTDESYNAAMTEMVLTASDKKGQSDTDKENAEASSSDTSSSTSVANDRL